MRFRLPPAGLAATLIFGTLGFAATEKETPVKKTWSALEIASSR